MLKEGEGICPLLTVGFGLDAGAPMKCDPVHCMWAVPTTKLIDGKWQSVGYRCGISQGGNQIEGFGYHEGTDRP